MPTFAGAGIALLMLGALPTGSARDLHLLDRALDLPGGAITLTPPLQTLAPNLSVPREPRVIASSVRGDEENPLTEGGGDEGAEQKPERANPKEPGSLDFDLLGTPARPTPVDEGALRRRRTLLTWHQGVGLGMFALQLATTVVGQLNYDDKFGGDNTGKYVQTHAILAYSTLAAFAAAGTLALLAPAPLRRDEGFDRVKLHKLAMIAATAGMVAQGVLGIWTQSREGYLNQQSIGTAHLVIGYVTLAAVAAGVSAIVF